MTTHDDHHSGTSEPLAAETARLAKGQQPLHIAAICGSLRQGSSNRAVLDAAVRLAPPGVTVSIFEGLAEIPAFNPDLDVEPAPPGVVRFRAAFTGAHAVLLSSPEYAHGVSGVMKNALDWVVGSGELIDKPIALVNATTRATIAHAALRETLVTMSAVFVNEASITLPLDGRRLDGAGIATDPSLSAALTAALDALVRSALAQR